MNQRFEIENMLRESLRGNVEERKGILNIQLKNGKHLSGKVVGLGGLQKYSPTPATPVSPVFFRNIIPANEQSEKGIFEEIKFHISDIVNIQKFS